MPTVAEPSDDFHDRRRSYGHKLPAAQAFLRDALADEDWHPHSDLFAAAEDLGYKPITLRRALDGLLDDGEIEQQRRDRVSWLRMSRPCHALGIEALVYYPKRDASNSSSLPVAPPPSATPPCATSTRTTFPTPGATSSATGCGAPTTSSPSARRKRGAGTSPTWSGSPPAIPSTWRDAASPTPAISVRWSPTPPARTAAQAETDAKYEVIGVDAETGELQVEVVTPAREHLWYEEITLPSPDARRRFMVALRQAEKRVRDAVKVAGGAPGAARMSSSASAMARGHGAPPPSACSSLTRSPFPPAPTPAAGNDSRARKHSASSPRRS